MKDQNKKPCLLVTFARSHENETKKKKQIIKIM